MYSSNLYMSVFILHIKKFCHPPHTIGLDDKMEDLRISGEWSDSLYLSHREKSRIQNLHYILHGKVYYHPEKEEPFTDWLCRNPHLNHKHNSCIPVCG
jgi:hypothetical protein